MYACGVTVDAQLQCLCLALVTMHKEKELYITVVYVSLLCGLC